MHFMKNDNAVLKIDTEKIKAGLVEFIRNTIAGKGFTKVALGLSGGVDSAVVAHLSAAAIGPGNVIGAVMPYGESDAEGLKLADIVAARLKIKKYLINIAPMVDAYFENFPDADNIRRGNKMARERMSILYDLSKKENALVIGSGNKTEISLGYCTLYGDTACALRPLANLYKTQVYALARHLGVPEEVIKRRPTAGLWAGQTDEEEIGYPYDKIDRLLLAMDGSEPGEKGLIEKGFEKDFIADIKRRREKSEFKRKGPATP